MYAFQSITEAAEGGQDWPSIGVTGGSWKSLKCSCGNVPGKVLGLDILNDPLLS